MRCSCQATAPNAFCSANSQPWQRLRLIPIALSFWSSWRRASAASDRKSTRLNSSHTVIYILSLHDALPICPKRILFGQFAAVAKAAAHPYRLELLEQLAQGERSVRSEEHTSELQSHSDLHSFPTRRSSDLPQTHSVRPIRSRGKGCGSSLSP